MIEGEENDALSVFINGGLYVVAFAVDESVAAVGIDDMREDWYLRVDGKEFSIGSDFIQFMVVDIDLELDVIRRGSSVVAFVGRCAT